MRNFSRLSSSLASRACFAIYEYRQTIFRHPNLRRCEYRQTIFRHPKPRRCRMGASCRWEYDADDVTHVVFHHVASGATPRRWVSLLHAHYAKSHGICGQWGLSQVCSHSLFISSLSIVVAKEHKMTAERTHRTHSRTPRRHTGGRTLGMSPRRSKTR